MADSKKQKVRRRRWLKATGVCLLLLSIGVFAANRTVLASAEGRIFTELSHVPERRVALVLGTSPKLDGRLNLFFQSRIKAAADLYRAGKAHKLLVSGDNGTPFYDEPDAMKAALIKRGVPAEDIVCDYAGFRTLDSIIRAKRVFGLKSLTIITDDFHLPRALYIAQHEEVDAIGYQTEPLPRSVAPQVYLREVASRTLVWLDINVLNRQPKLLGPPEKI